MRGATARPGWRRELPVAEQPDPAAWDLGRGGAGALGGSDDRNHAGAGQGAINAGTSTFSGALTLHPIPAPPAVGVWLCLGAQPRVSGDEVQPVRLWTGPVKINTQCRFGMDQTCNHDTLVSALYGTCNANGTCTCGPGLVKDPTSGRCKTP